MTERSHGECDYAVVWPLGRRASRSVVPAERHHDLAGKTVCELWDLLFRGEEIYPLIREELSRRYPGIKFIDYSAFGNTHGAKQSELVAALPELLKRYGCDAVVSGIGA